MSAFTSSSIRSILRAAPSAAAPARSFSSSSARALARMNITGRMGGDPELMTSQNGRQYVRYLLASEQGSKDRTTSWWRVAAFVSDAQRDYLLTVTKGTLVSVDADVQQRKYTDAQGMEQTTLAISQRQLEVLKRPFNPNRESGNQPQEGQE